MRFRLRGCWFGLLSSTLLTALVGGLCLSPGKGQGQPPGGREKAAKDELGTFYLKGLLQRDKPKPVNGVTVRIEVKPVPAEKPDAVEAEWVLKYSGPRPPLVILPPSLTDGVKDRETELMFFATGKSGKTYGYGYRNPVDLFGVLPGDAPANSFLTLKAGEGGRGTLLVKTADLRDNLRKREPDEFDRTRPPKLHVKLYLNPTDRGAKHGLDAWTGELESNIVPLTLAKW